MHLLLAFERLSFTAQLGFFHERQIPIAPHSSAWSLFRGVVSRLFPEQLLGGTFPPWRHSCVA